MSLTERALEILIPIIGHQMKFLLALEKEKECSAASTATASTADNNEESKVSAQVVDKTLPCDKKVVKQTRYGFILLF